MLVFLVICRVGSLEIPFLLSLIQWLVVCRIGSLENIDEVPSYVGMLVCRTGSLETRPTDHVTRSGVVCRTGSLEISLRQVVTSFLVVCRIGSFRILRPRKCWCKVVIYCTGELGCFAFVCSYILFNPAVITGLAHNFPPKIFTLLLPYSIIVIVVRALSESKTPTFT